MKYLLSLLLISSIAFASGIFPGGTKVTVNASIAPGCKGIILDYHKYDGFIIHEEEYKIEVTNCTIQRQDGYSYFSKKEIIWVPVNYVTERQK